jgi:antirestriction protein ArdC
MQKTTPKPSIYQTVTDRILSSLKAGVIPWEKPWQTPHFTGGPFPRNFHTGKPYRGINVFLLWSGPYASPFWLTFKQAQDLKGNVRKGEKGTQIVFYKQLRDSKKKDETPREDDDRAPFVLCYYIVFNVEQCDGLKLPEIVQPTAAQEIDADDTCEAIVSGWENRPTLHLTSESEHAPTIGHAPTAFTCPCVRASWMRRTTTALSFTNSSTAQATKAA